MGTVWGALGIPTRQAPVGAVESSHLGGLSGSGCCKAAHLLLDCPSTCCTASVLVGATWVLAPSVLITVGLSSAPVELLLRPAEHTLHLRSTGVTDGGPEQSSGAQRLS